MVLTVVERPQGDLVQAKIRTHVLITEYTGIFKN